jgi:hypothetical protein
MDGNFMLIKMGEGCVSQAAEQRHKETKQELMH